MSGGAAEAQPQGWTGAVLGLGGNLGDRRANLARAAGCLAADPDIRLEAASALYETAPWGKTDQPPFLNAALAIATGLAPLALLDRALAIEKRLGRDRREAWGPRLIDIDILLYGEAEVLAAGLTVPHPHLHARAFALAPLLDVRPNAMLRGRPAGDWLADLADSGIRRIAGPEWAELRRGA